VPAKASSAGSRTWVTLIGACFFALMLLLPMVNLKSHVQREKARMLGKGSIGGGSAPAAA
jgi:hypothetical protein